MSYTILKSDGTVLTTIADGTVNTTSTSLGLPGRNYAGYGSILDTNFVHLTENFADTTPPANALQGQLWYDKSSNTIRVCPTQYETNAAAWLTLTSSGSNTTFGNLTVTGNITVNNISATNNCNANAISTNFLTVNTSATMTNITTGGNTIAGNITGNWTLTSGSRLQATYADLAERFESDIEYDAGTVVQLGGDKEITMVKFELSEDVFGVISDTAAYLMNAGAGNDKTHPPVAVSGRVQVKVKGKVKKGDRLVSAGNGLARAAKSGEANAFNTIGRALSDKNTDDLGTVEAIVIIR